MEIETILFIITAVILDILIITYAGKRLLAFWRKINADGKITADEIIDGVEEVVETIKDVKDKLGGEEE
ncbi:hypothetical protein N8748_00590 [bacterium]|nr:hypothetical protein [bacterium]